MTGRVLVVDDLVQNVKLLEAKLSSEYYTVFSAYSGVEALSKVRELAPDIILLDVMMPGMDGFEVCKKLKADPETAYIPVVMVTALSEKEARVQGLRSGASDFITKPIDEVHLFARVKSLIRLKTILDELRMRDKTGTQFGMTNYAPLYNQPGLYGSILVIDDDVVQLKTIQETLSRQGHKVRVSDHKEALSIVNATDYDLIIVNTLLDDEDGLRLAMQIRGHLKTRQVPIMILVDEDDKVLLVKGLEIGIDDYLLTPMDSNELVARAATQIRSKKYQDALRSSYKENLSAAVMDSLTKLYNRRYLDAHLTNMVEEAMRKKTPISVISVDIDHFKAVNDRPGWGHHIGDEVLEQVADRIRSSIRNTDLPTRPGGEEFVIVLPGTNLENAKVVGERIRKSMADSPFKISAEPGIVNCTVSVGISTLGHNKDNSADLLKRSDEALYQAKKTGRNMVCVM